MALQMAKRIGKELHVSGPLSRPRGILVIDDNEDVCAFLGRGLGAYGFTVWVAGGGRAGVALYLAHRTAIDIVLLDVRMPDWDGPATLSALRALDPDVTCYFMSGDTGPYTEEHLIGLGASGVLEKPFRLDDLLAHIRVSHPSP